jgi:hypothetical protein
MEQLPVCSYSLYSLWIQFLLVLTVCISTTITTNNIHGVNTRQNTDLHLISVRLTAFKERAYLTGIRIFNNLPANVKQLANKIELFKSVLKRYLLLQSFYSLDVLSHLIVNVTVLLYIMLLYYCTDIMYLTCSISYGVNL